MRPLDCVIFARGRLLVSRPYTDGVLAHLCRLEPMLHPTCTDRPGAAKELRALVRELRRLPMPPAGSGLASLLNDPVPLSGVPECAGLLTGAARALERGNV